MSNLSDAIDAERPEQTGRQLAEAALRDIGRIRTIAEELLKQSTRVEAAIRSAYPEATVCLHTKRIELTTMGASERSFVCGDCSHQWTEPLEAFDVTTGDLGDPEPT